MTNGTHDVLARYTMRVMVFDAERDSHKALCEWLGKDETPFAEDATTRINNDLSTLEELEMTRLRAQHLTQCLVKRPRMSKDAISDSCYKHGGEMRVYCIERYGYAPEQSTVPEIPVTIDGPADLKVYMRRNGMEKRKGH